MTHLPTRLVFLTDDDREFADAAAVLSEITLRQDHHATKPQPQTTIIDAARSAILDAFQLIGEPAFLVQSALVLKGASPNDDSLIWKSCDDLSEEEFCDRFHGTSGVIAQVLSFCDNAGHVEIFQRDIPGVVSLHPTKSIGSGFDRIWIPNGYKETLADLSLRTNTVARRKRLYFDLASHLGLKTANDLYEIHVTVDYSGDISHFEKTCKELGVKAIHIELPYGSAPSHHITGSFHKGSLENVKGDAKRIALALSDRGFEVTRVKIEAMIRNSLVPLKNENAPHNASGNYFEFHVKIAVDRQTNLKHLMAQCVDFGAHLSRNASNKMADGVVMHFATLRVHQGGRDAAVAYFQSFLSHLRVQGYKLSNILQEYTVFDTNIALDDGWFNPNKVPNFRSELNNQPSNQPLEEVDVLLPPTKHEREANNGSFP